MAKLLIVAAVALTCVIAEPPIARQGGYASQPSGRYGAPEASGRFGGPSIPSTQYGVPGSLSTQYATTAGSSRSGNGASSRFGGSNAPSNQYGVPGASGRSLSTQYGAPSVSSRFGSPSSLPVSGRFGGASSLSSQYGAPGASSRFGGTSSLSTQYGAPSGSSRFSAPGGGYAASRGGYNAQEDDLAEPANYQYSYEVQDPESGAEFSQEESRQDESAQGSYRVLLPDGRLQIVEYEADQEGYRPQIRYEDTGAGYSSGPQQRGQGGPY